MGEAMRWNKRRVVGRRKNGRPEVKYTEASEQRLIGEPTPALVSPEVWHTAQATINRMRTYTNHINTHERFRLLAGMVRCGCCGGCMTTQKIPGRGGVSYFYYTCLNRRNRRTACVNPRQQISAVEQSVWSQVREFITDDAAIRRAVEKAQGRAADLTLELAHHKEGLRKAEETADRLVGSLAGLEDDVVLQPLRKRLLGISKQAQTDRAAIADLEARQQLGELATQSLADILSKCGALSRLIITANGREHVRSLVVEGPVQIIEDITPETKREILQGCGCRVTLLDKRVRVELEPLVSSTNSPTRRGSSIATSSPAT
jgi:hypothetical protein